MSVAGMVTARLAGAIAIPLLKSFSQSVLGTAVERQIRSAAEATATEVLEAELRSGLTTEEAAHCCDLLADLITNSNLTNELLLGTATPVDWAREAEAQGLDIQTFPISFAKIASGLSAVLPIKMLDQAKLPNSPLHSRYAVEMLFAQAEGIDLLRLETRHPSKRPQLDKDLAIVLAQRSSDPHTLAITTPQLLLASLEVPGSRIAATLETTESGLSKAVTARLKRFEMSAASAGAMARPLEQRLDFQKAQVLSLNHHLGAVDELLLVLGFMATPSGTLTQFTGFLNERYLRFTIQLHDALHRFYIPHRTPDGVFSPSSRNDGPLP